MLERLLLTLLCLTSLAQGFLLDPDNCCKQVEVEAGGFDGWRFEGRYVLGSYFWEQVLRNGNYVITYRTAIKRWVLEYIGNNGTKFWSERTSETCPENVPSLSCFGECQSDSASLQIINLCPMPWYFLLLIFLGIAVVIIVTIVSCCCYRNQQQRQMQEPVHCLQMTAAATGGGGQIRGCPDFWWNFKTFISKLHNLFLSQSIFNLEAPRWAQ